MLVRTMKVTPYILILLLIVACAPATGDGSPGNEPAGNVLQMTDLPEVEEPIDLGGDEPPPATLTIDGREQTAGIGSYCWTTRDPAQPEAVAICADMIGIPTDDDPLPAEATFTARFHLPIEERPDRLFLHTFQVTDADALPNPQEGWRWWSPKPGQQHTLSPADRDIELSLEPGLNVIMLNVGWPELGDASYGFLVDVDGWVAESPIQHATAADGHAIYLPTLPEPAEEMMAALMDGLLVEDGGCLRLVDQGYPDGFLVIWPFGSELKLINDGIEVHSRQRQVVARVGDALRVGGGAIENSSGISFYDNLIAGLPLDGCPGPYWVAADIETLEEQAIADLWVHPFSSGDRILATFFEQSRAHTGTDALTGELHIGEDGCLRVDDYLMFWPPDFFLKEDPLRIANMERTVEVEVGDRIRVTGSDVGPDDYRYFENKVTCEGPYWGANEVSAVE